MREGCQVVREWRPHGDLKRVVSSDGVHSCNRERRAGRMTLIGGKGWKKKRGCEGRRSRRTGEAERTG